MPIPPIRFVALLTAVMLLMGCGDSDAADPKGQGADPLDLPAPPDDWSLTVIDAQGLTALREQTAAKGQVLVVYFWASRCEPCVAMIPKLHAALDERSEQVRLVSLSVDEGQVAQTQAHAHLIAHQAWADAHVAQAGAQAKEALAAAASTDWDGGSLPAVFVYGPDGQLVHQLLETRGQPADWVAAIVSAVDEAAGR